MFQLLISVNVVATTPLLFFIFYRFLFFFSIFIFHSLSYDTISICIQAKRSSVKLDTYRKFSNALAVAVIASVVWIGYEVYSSVKIIYFLLF